MNRTLIAVAAVATLSACAHNSRSVGMVDKTNLRAENHTVWTRPTEVGFQLGGEISASATARRVLGFNVGESKPGSSVLAVFAPFSGAKLSPVGSFAAYKAVTDARAEGIYVTRVETESSGFLFFSNNETVTVYGRALTMKDYGPIKEARADRWRYRDYGADTVVVKEGRAEVNLPVEVK